MSDVDWIRFTVPEHVLRERADKVLALALPQESRAAVQRLFESEQVRSSTGPITKNHKLSGGDVVEYFVPPVRPTELRPAAIPLDVLFEDDDLVVVNKPAGMVVHPGAGTQGDTLVHALLAHCAGNLSGIGGVERPGIVHRLDRETSGVIVSAKNDRAHRGLARAFAERTLEKEYLALVQGVPGLLAGTIKKPITRHAVHRHRMTIAPTGGEGRDAHTDWSREAAYAGVAALVRCRIHTGRTHQIRVHLKSIGHPILGDTTYGWRRDPRMPVQPERVMLHAARLAFDHPIDGRHLEIVAPIPADFVALIARLETL
ncbi:RluA family pseudouridine synthase [Opitutales bacterium ASA1]|uniref:RluA family pseudouridine synthase n=1 Tax=Congregicoccus parvus TaxID=3081749 RepID=UPI002B3101B6|nr:RluA family pseudouridine synthase [Opitutales bacterium ASA1]